MIDDLDFAAINNTENVDYSVCWALISAAIDFANDLPNVRCLISVRSDIWHIIINNKRLGAERIDKIQKPVSLSFDEIEIRKMFNKRLELASKKAGATRLNSKLFFDNEYLTLPGTQAERRSWDQWISKNSREKPRDMVQLVQKLVEQARVMKTEKINSEVAKEIMLDFAVERISNISAEYQQICPEIKAVIEQISIRTLFSFEELMDILKKAPSVCSIKVDGVALTPNDNLSAIKLLQILHMANFLNPRQEFNDATYIHHKFDSNNTFISHDNWNQLNQYRWEIHPTFHSYIENKKRITRNLTNTR